jgi:hypothetical protein
MLHLPRSTSLRFRTSALTFRLAKQQVARSPLPGVEIAVVPAVHEKRPVAVLLAGLSSGSLLWAWRQDYSSSAQG